MCFLKGSDRFRTVKLQYSHSFFTLDLLLKTERSDTECNKVSESQKVRTLRKVNNMYKEKVNCRGVLQRNRKHQDYTGSLLFLDKYWHAMPYVKKQQTCKFRTKYLQLIFIVAPRTLL
jgi:hypothetical protein